MIRAFKVFIPTSIFSLFLIEAAIVCGCFLAAPYLDPADTLPRALIPVWITNEGALGITLAVVTVLLPLYFMSFYSGQRWGRLILIQRLAFVIGITLLVQAFFSLGRPDLMLPRRIMLTGSGLTFLSLIGSRVLLYRAIAKLEERGRILFLGMSPVVEQLAVHLQGHPEVQIFPYGYLDEEDRGTPGGMQWLGPVSQWVQRVDELQPEWLMIGDRRKIAPEWTEDLVELGFGGVRVEDASTLYETMLSRFCLSDWRPSEIFFSDSFQYRQVSLNLQSLVSITVGVVLGIVALPVFAGIWLVLKITGGGKVLVGEDRIGLCGEPIRVYRFGCREKSWLSRSRLEGLPILWNLVKGDISLIGPEAHRAVFAARLSRALPLYGLRHLVKPGIVGWAQVNAGQTSEMLSAQTALEYDLYYVKYFSPSLDVYILLKAMRDIVSRYQARD